MTSEVAISRQAVLDMIEGFIADATSHGISARLDPYYVMDGIKGLPPVTTQQTWIPCSERLPKKGGDYLTTTFFDIGAKEPVREVYKNFFCVLSQKWLNCDEDVIAWMPLPESYKGE